MSYTHEDFEREARGIITSALMQRPMTSLDHGAIAALSRIIAYVTQLEQENERLKDAINPEAANTPADRWDEFAAMVDKARESEAYKDESRKLKALDDAMTVQLPDHRDDLDPQVRILTHYVEVLREAVSENDDCERMATAVAIAQANVASELANLREENERLRFANREGNRRVGERP